MAITNQDLFRMVRHWLGTPENGYLGSGYGGQNLALAALDGVLSDESNSAFMRKIRADVPALANYSIGVVKLQSQITFSLGADSETYTL